MISLKYTINEQQEIDRLNNIINELEKENDDLKNRLDNEVAENTLRLKEIEQLEKENETLNGVLETLKETNNLLINQKYKLEYELDKLDNKYEQLENIRKDAIRFIKEYCIDDELYFNLSYKEKAIIEVLNILDSKI